MTHPRRSRARRSPGASPGFSFVEVLVSVVLIGTTVIATLVALRTTIAASNVAEDRARLVAWVQDGVEAVHRTAYVPCTSGVAAATAAYQGALDATTPPDGWSTASLQLTDLRFASVDPVTFIERWDTACDVDRPAQRLTIEAAAPDGSPAETLQVVIDG